MSQCKKKLELKVATLFCVDEDDHEGPHTFHATDFDLNQVAATIDGLKRDVEGLRACVRELCVGGDMVLEVRDLRAAVESAEQAQHFAIELFSKCGWPHSMDLDGFELQDLAVKHGLLVPEQRTTYCGDGCACAEYDTDLEVGFTCYRKAPWLMSKNKSEE